MHAGEDTDFYLRKGFRVVAVEANPARVVEARSRFAGAVAEGRLEILNVAIHRTGGVTPFYVNREHDDWRTVDEEVATRIKIETGTSFDEIEVPAVRFDEVIAQFGIPYYLKIDIEGADLLCLAALHRCRERPLYLSMELQEISHEELNEMCALGYRYFKVVDQAAHSHTVLPNPPRAGVYIEHCFPNGASGPFGEETVGEWLGLGDAFAVCSDLISRKKRGGSWYDLHGKLERM